MASEAIAEGKIKKWGNSAALRLSADVLKAAHLHMGEYVVFEVMAGGVLIRPAGRRKIPSLAEMIAGCDASAPMPDDLAGWVGGAPVGEELI